MVATVVVALAAILFACPLSMTVRAQMTTMTDQDMGVQSASGLCHLSCGVPLQPAGLESSRFVPGPFPAQLAPDPASTIRPLFHPPPLA